VEAESLERHDELTRILAGLFANIQAQGRVTEALPWVHETLAIAETTGDADLLITGHINACVGHSWVGELAKALEKSLLAELG
jgi:hypothetical protein